MALVNPKKLMAIFIYLKYENIISEKEIAFQGWIELDKLTIAKLVK
jgi:hypothetical protein